MFADDGKLIFQLSDLETLKDKLSIFSTFFAKDQLPLNALKSNHMAV